MKKEKNYYSKKLFIKDVKIKINFYDLLILNLESKK